MTRATAQEFQAWKERCIADPTILDRLFSKELATFYKKEFGIVESPKKSAVITSSHEVAVTIYINSSSTLEQVFEFSMMAQILHTAGTINDEIFAEMVEAVRQWTLINLMSFEVFEAEFMNWVKK